MVAFKIKLDQEVLDQIQGLVSDILQANKYIPFRVDINYYQMFVKFLALHLHKSGDQVNITIKDSKSRVYTEDITSITLCDGYNSSITFHGSEDINIVFMPTRLSKSLNDKVKAVFTYLIKNYQEVSNTKSYLDLEEAVQALNKGQTVLGLVNDAWLNCSTVRVPVLLEMVKFKIEKRIYLEGMFSEKDLFKKIEELKDGQSSTPSIITQAI